MLSTCEKFNRTNLYFPFSENKKGACFLSSFMRVTHMQQEGEKLHIATHNLKFHQRGMHLLGFIRL
jgi:hypothetical protein